MEDRSGKKGFIGGQSLAVLIAGALIGSTLLAPVGAHVGGTVGHLWKEHIRPLADKRYFTKAQSNSRFINDLDGTVATNNIADGAVTGAKLANSSVSTAKLADLSVSTAKLAGSSVSTAKLANSSVSTAKLADLSVSTAKLAGSSVSTAKLANGAVTASKIGTIIEVEAGSGLISNGGHVLSVIATCPTGTRVISGGFKSSQLSWDIRLNRRSGNGWQVSGTNRTGGSSHLDALAYCLAA